MDLGQRIRAVRKACGHTQQSFADLLGLKQNTIATYEIEKTTPSDRTILDICRVFHVNESWLRTGEGEMFQLLSPDEEIAAFLGDVMGGTDFRARLIAALAHLSDQDWAVLERLARELGRTQE